LLRNQVGGVLEEWRNSLEEEPGLWKTLVEQYALLRGATCQMSAPFSEAEVLTEAYDLVVVDEAARTDPGELMIPLTLGKRILLVGDQKQLPPFVDSLVVRRLEAEDSSYLALLNEQSFFGELFEALPENNKTMLNRQYRSHPIIGNAISAAFYQGLLKSGPEDRVARASWQAERTPFWGLHENHPLCWIDTDQTTCQRSTTSNPVESELAIGMITKALPKVEGTEKQIGVIGFYQDQVKNLQAQLEKAVPNYSRFLEVGTVDSFQGKEFPLVILLTSRFDPTQGRVGFLALPNRVNVAVSRAQRQLLIIGSVNTLLHKDEGSPPFKAFASAAGTDLHYIAP
jgi:superfamily I DNA and/or RNA helicase